MFCYARCKLCCLTFCGADLRQTGCQFSSLLPSFHYVDPWSASMWRRGWFHNQTSDFKLKKLFVVSLFFFFFAVGLLIYTLIYTFLIDRLIIVATGLITAPSCRSTAHWDQTASADSDKEVVFLQGLACVTPWSLSWLIPVLAMYNALLQ